MGDIYHGLWIGKLFRGELGLGRQRNIDQGSQEWHVLPRVKLDLLQRAVEVSQSPLCRDIGAAKARAAPFRDRMKRGVLQQLRAGPFRPGMRSLRSRI